MQSCCALQRWKGTVPSGAILSCSWRPDQWSSLARDAHVQGKGHEDPFWNRKNKTNFSSRFFCPLGLYLIVAGYQSPSHQFQAILKTRVGAWQNKWRLPSLQPVTNLTVWLHYGVPKSGQHPRKKEYFWYYSAVVLQAWKMGWEAEVADGCSDYPQLKDRGSEGEVEMWEEGLKEAISPSDFLVIINRNFYP